MQHRKLVQQFHVRQPYNHAALGVHGMSTGITGQEGFLESASLKLKLDGY